MTVYNKEFYDYISDGALRSAKKIAPGVMQLFKPKSVIDIGCGTGAWLKAFEELGATELYGVDGSDEGHELVENFELHDFSRPYIPQHKYDLAISLEVAEHIPEQYADMFVKTVARCADNILWSAAVPGQRGLNHVNEQFPSYWIPKFEDLGYSCNGSFRYAFWNDETVENWYRQNILLFSKNFIWNEPIRDLIHPNNYPNYGGDVEERFKL
jgi:SAM-dependent methyltransferase